MAHTVSHRARATSLLLGAGIAAVGAVAYTAGALDRLHRLGLDLHFRHVGGWEADPRVVLIDIDDRALQAPTAWPWPRRLHADVVNTLSELGAGSVVLDIIFSEPTAVRDAWDGLSLNRDLGDAIPSAGDLTDRDLIDDDEELRRAINASGRVFLALFCEFAPPGLPVDSLRSHALELFRGEPFLPGERIRSLLGTSARSLSDQLLETWRSAALLLTSFDTRDAELAERRQAGGVPECSELGGAARRLAAALLAERFLDQRPTGTWRDFASETFPGVSGDTLSPDRTLLMQAFRAEQGRRASLTRSEAADTRLATSLRAGTKVVAPLATLATAAKGVGLVSFDRASPDGVIRRLPMAALLNGSALPQLGLVAACDAEHKKCAVSRDEDGQVLVGDSGSAWKIPVGRDGTTWVGWVAPPERDRWDKTFVHIPVSRFLEIASNRRLMAENEARLALRRSELVRLRHRETPSEFDRYAALIRQRNERNGTESRETETPAASARQDMDTAAELEIKRVEQEAVEWLKWRHDLWLKESPRDEAERRDMEEIRTLHMGLAEGALARDVQSLNAKLALRVEELMTDLKPLVAGKICLVGYTASAEADLVSTPVASAMPGVMVHANVINMFLSRRFPRVAPAGWQVSAILLSGLGMTLVARRWSAVVGVVTLAILSLVLLAACAALFRASAIHGDALAAVAIAGACWAAVTAYRQATEERSRRRFQRALESYTSPAIAARIAERADPTDFAPRPAMVTCFFCDLEGFTPLSERLGPERTRDVLNPFLAEMTRVLAEHGAIVNKFIGDGVFAFFNSPILPLDNHAAKACAAALAAQQALTELNRRGRALTPLAMRIGLATGDVFVGDYGSGAKLDYTCIGDTVNLASRLEQANKTLGTRVLVSGETRAQAGTAFEFRSKGEVDLPGRTRRVEAFELLGGGLSA